MLRDDLEHIVDVRYLLEEIAEQLEGAIADLGKTCKKDEEPDVNEKLSLALESCNASIEALKDRESELAEEIAEAETKRYQRDIDALTEEYWRAVI